MSLQQDILVIGGGIVGLSAALAMAQRGYTVAVIDASRLQADTSKTDARVYAINFASERLLQQLEVWPHLDEKRVSLYHHMHVWDAVNGASIDFDSRDIAAKNLGAIIEESVLKQALLQQVALHPTITLFSECVVDKVYHDAQGVKVFNQEQVWEGQLLMVADGANSPVREMLKVDWTTWPYKQHALVATVAVEKTHQHTAYQVFNPDGPLAFLPLSDPHQCSIVWSSDPLHIKQLMALPEQEFNQALTQAFAKKLGEVKLIGTRYQFPLHMRHVKQYVGARWLLLGDAAHTIHPLAGLGLNVGLADVSSWIRCLGTTRGSLTSTKALGAYQRERKHAVWQVIILMQGLKQVFGHSFAPTAFLRGMGLKFCNQFTSIKRLFIQHARGD